jgi:copper(I)-binding protein
MKNIFSRKTFILLISLFSMVGYVNASSTITVTDGYIKASIPGSDITAAFMTLNNTGDKAITLTRITGSISDRIEIHEHSMADGMMRMRQVDSITLKANSSVVLQPSGLHLMVFSIKQQLTEQDVISLTLTFSNDTEVKIQLPVRKYK